MNISNNNNSISLEEDNFFSEPKTNKSKKQGNKNKSKTSNSFFGKIINSVSKIGQGLKNIMSMKINYEDEDDYNPNLYEQISSRFNNNEEISLIDAPSFMEESNIQNQSNKKNESNIMMISQNEINNDNDIINNNVINNIINFNNSINHQKEEIINTDIIPNNERKLSIKSTFLNKKRLNDRHLENIFEERNEEEEKNEEENLNVNISGNKNKILNKNKFENSFDSSRIKMNRTNSNIKNNTFKMNKLNNTSMMSLSMRSLDNIKNEISKRREENLRSVQDMYKKNSLKYNDKEDEQLREKILKEYYADKAKRNAEVKLKLEREKQRREEEFKKLKIRKESGFKYGSIPKKQNILSEMKSTEINFKPSYKKVIINNNSSILSQKEETKQINPNITFGNISNSQSQTNEIKIINNDNNNDNNDIAINKKKLNLKEEPKSLFGPSEIKIDEEKKQKESESKTNTGLFSNTESNLNAFNNNKKEENKNTPFLFGNTNNEKKPIFDNRKQSIFSNMIVPPEKEKEKKEEIKTTNDKKQEDFFGSSINLEFKKNDESSLFKGNSDMKGIFGTQISNEKGGLFDQNNQVSQGINPKSLFNSNKPPINSLVTQNNPFLKASNSNKGSTTNLFGVSSNNENNTQKQTSTTSLFGGFTPNPGKSLFG